MCDLAMIAVDLDCVSPPGFCYESIFENITIAID
jgi:hypothetical protein